MATLAKMKLDFIATVIEDFGPELKVYLHENRGKKFDFPISSRNIYSYQIFEISVKILDTINTLDKVIVYLKNYTPSKEFIMNDIFHFDYVKYHLEVYHTKVITLLDQMLILTNMVFDLGFPSNQCNYNNITSNNHLKDTLTVKILKNYNKAFQNFKEIRNDIIHKGDYEDNSFNEFEIDYVLFKYARPALVSEVELKKKLKPILKTKISQCERLNKVIAKGLIKFFNSLNEKYTEVYKRKVGA